MRPPLVVYVSSWMAFLDIESTKPRTPIAPDLSLCEYPRKMHRRLDL